MILPKVLVELSTQLAKLPGIGQKSATRIAFSFAGKQKDLAKNLGLVLEKVSHNLGYCENCFMLVENSKCLVCNNPQRDQSIICVVEEAINIFSIEESNFFTGLYHVLGGVISPINGVMASDLNIDALLKRLDSGIKEIIIATNPTLEGEATAHFIKNLIHPKEIKVSRLAIGIPSGGYIEYTDQNTLGYAFKGRTNF